MRAAPGVNITDPFARWDYLFSQSPDDPAVPKGYLDLIRPRAVVVVGSASLVRALLDCFPSMIIVARRWGIEDNNRHRVPGEMGDIWVSDMLAWLGFGPGEAPHNLYLMYDNEPTYNGLQDGDDEYVQLADDRLLIRRTLEVYRAGYASGVKIIGPNWSVAWPRDPAMFTEIYAAAVQYGMMIGMHIYGLCSLNDSRTLNWFLSQADEIAGLQEGIEIGLTELGTSEFFPDVDPYSGPWRWMGTSERDHALDIWTFIKEPLVERPYIKFATVFCWGTTGGWHDYDVSTAYEWQKLMTNFDWETEEPVPTLPDGYTPAAVSSTDLAGTRVRKGPGLTEIVGLLNFAPMAGGYDPVGIVKDGYTWVHIWTPLISGWCARQFVRLDTGGQGEDCAELRQQLATVTEQRDIALEKIRAVEIAICGEAAR